MFLFVNSDWLHSYTPTTFGSARLAAQGLSDHLVSKTNTNGFPLVPMEGTDKSLEILYPLLILEY